MPAFKPFSTILETTQHTEPHSSYETQMFILLYKQTFMDISVILTKHTNNSNENALKRCLLYTWMFTPDYELFRVQLYFTRSPHTNKLFKSVRLPQDGTGDY